MIHVGAERSGQLGYRSLRQAVGYQGHCKSCFSVGMFSPRSTRQPVPPTKLLIMLSANSGPSVTRLRVVVSCGADRVVTRYPRPDVRIVGTTRFSRYRDICVGQARHQRCRIADRTRFASLVSSPHKRSWRRHQGQTSVSAPPKTIAEARPAVYRGRRAGMM